MSQEMDISWHMLRRIVQDWRGDSAELVEVMPLDGGCISTTAALSLGDGSRAVCKISQHRIDRSYVNEAHQLRLCAEIGVPTPKVFAAKLGSLEEPFSYILMEFVDGVTLPRAKQLCSGAEFDQLQYELAQMVLKLHERTQRRYCRAEVEPAPAEFESWPSFYREVFDPIFEEVVKSTLLPIKCRKLIGRIHERLDRLLAHDDVPRLVHWDIWGTNVLCRANEAGEWKVAAILDPNCKYAHFEAELAYMALFRTCTPAFMKCYQGVRKLKDDYHRVRKPVYQLYFLLNHLNLFGAAYARDVMEIVDRLGAMV
jgi:fructosamine-3-kinase